MPIPPCTHREVKPVRQCSRCGCYLRSYGNEALCDPCSPKPAIESYDDAFGQIADMKDYRRRREAFEVLAEQAA